MVMTVVKEIGNPRLGTVRSKMLARKVEIPTWGADDLNVNGEWIGLKGSPTKVVKIYSPKLARKGRLVVINQPADLEQAGQAFIEFLLERGLEVYLPKCGEGGRS
jgi:electron transfer flavoprotein beta subunit